MKTKNLSLAEAHASGKKYRIVGYTGAYYRNVVGCEVSWMAAISQYELEPEAKLLTRDEVEAAIVKAMPHASFWPKAICDQLFGQEDV